MASRLSILQHASMHFFLKLKGVDIFSPIERVEKTVGLRLRGRDENLFQATVHIPVIYYSIF